MVSMFKTGVQCLRCGKVLFDKSNFNRHHVLAHQDEGLAQFQLGVLYAESDGVATTEFGWTYDALPQAIEKAAAPGLLERETKILSKASSLYSEGKWALGEPGVHLQDEATSYIDAIDEIALRASTLLRAQVMRSKGGNVKIVPFQPLKDTSGAHYAKTLAWFKLFAENHFRKSGSMQELVQQAIQEKCNSQTVCCLEGFLFWATQYVPNMKNADPLQHAAMHMRRVVRGTAILFLSENPGEDIEPFCNIWLNPTKGVSFMVLTSMYYEIKRCVPHDKRLLIQRADPDEGYPAGSAVLASVHLNLIKRFDMTRCLQVDTGRELVRVTWSMMRNIILSTVESVTAALNQIQLPGKVKLSLAKG